MQSTITITINHDDELAPNSGEHEVDALAELVRTVCDRVRLARREGGTRSGVMV